MKKKMSIIIAGILFLAGLSLLLYPLVANQWNTYRQSRLISDYEKVVSDMKPEDYTEEWEAAREFDSTLVQNNIYGDVFGSDDTQIEDTDYWNRNLPLLQAKMGKYRNLKLIISCRGLYLREYLEEEKLEKMEKLRLKNT